MAAIGRLLFSQKVDGGLSRHAFWLEAIVVAFVTFAHAAGADPADDVEQVVARFHAAITGGDRASALVLLAADAVVIENGRIESRSEYAAQHLAADIDFARYVKVQRTKPRVIVDGHIAWVSSVSTVTGRFMGQPVNLLNAELMVLARHEGRWLIRAIHWSSRAQ